MKKSKFRATSYLVIGFAASLMAFAPPPAVAEESDPAASVQVSPSGGSRSRDRVVSFPTAVPRTAPSANVLQNQLPQEPEDTGPESLPPYQEELRRLAEILGAVHYLRQLCGADEGELWRAQMEDLLDAEEPGPKWRAQLVEEFNRGYRTFERSYRQCTASAVLATRRYMNEGAELTLVTQNTYAN